MPFTGFTGYIIGGLMLVIVLMGGAGYLYYKDSQGTIRQLEQDKATAVANQTRLEGEIQEQNKSISLLEQTRAEDQQKILDLSDKEKTAREEADRLRKIFQNHNLLKLSLKKPGVIERKINNGTEKVFEELEAITKPPVEEVVK